CTAIDCRALTRAVLGMMLRRKSGANLPSCSTLSQGLLSMPETLSIALSASLPEAAQAIVLYADDKGSLGPVAAEIWQRTGLDFERIAKATGFAGRPGHMIDIPVPTGLTADRLLVLGRGTDGEGDSEAAWRDRGGSLFARLAAADVSDVAVILDEPGLTPRLVAAQAAGARLRSYRFDKHLKRRKKPEDAAKQATLVIGALKGVEDALADALAVGDGPIL